MNMDTYLSFTNKDFVVAMPCQVSFQTCALILRPKTRTPSIVFIFFVTIYVLKKIWKHERRYE